MVEQDIFLFTGTVKENLALWDTSIADKHLKKACQDAAIDDVAGIGFLVFEIEVEQEVVVN